MTINLELYQKLDDRQKLEYILLNGDKLVNLYSGKGNSYTRRRKLVRYPVALKKFNI